MTIASGLSTRRFYQTSSANKKQPQSFCRCFFPQKVRTHSSCACACACAANSCCKSCAFSGCNTGDTGAGAAGFTCGVLGLSVRHRNSNQGKNHQRKLFFPKIEEAHLYITPFSSHWFFDNCFSQALWLGKKTLTERRKKNTTAPKGWIRWVPASD